MKINKIKSNNYMYTTTYHIDGYEFDEYLLKIKNLNNKIKKIDEERYYYIRKINNVLIKKEQQKIKDIKKRIDYLESMIIDNNIN